MDISEILETMDYGPAPEDASMAMQWLEDRGGNAGHFIDGQWGPLRQDFETFNPANASHLAYVTKGDESDVKRAVAAARKAQPKWAKIGGAARARVLYAIARQMQKHARLLAVMETLDNGKPIRESRDLDIPLAIRHFYYHAGLAQLFDSECKDQQAVGVCGQIVPWNFPLLMLAWKIAPALAAGNTVILKPAEYTSLSAMVFAEICDAAGVPPGVVNIVTGDGETGAHLVNSDVDKIAFTGSTEVGRKIRKATAGSGKSLTLELGGKSPYIVFDDADIDSAIEGLVDAIWFNQGQVCCAGSRLLVQEGIAEDFYERLRRRMAKLRIGNPLDKCIDVGAVVDPVQLATITRMVDGARQDGAVHQPVGVPSEGCFYPPTLITGLHPAHDLMQEEIFGPVLVSTTFRTPAEAIQIANNTRYGLAATLWSENINLALDVAPKLVSGVVWVNATNLFDAAAGFGGVRESGFGREGGWEGLAAYTKPKVTPAQLKQPKTNKAKAATARAGIDRTAKFYIGGKQSRPDGGYSRTVIAANGSVAGEVGVANRKDIRNAVEAAHAAKNWSKSTAHLRAQIIYYIAENLSARQKEFTARLTELTGQSQKTANAEVEAAIDRLFHWAAWADKHDGRSKGVPMRGIAMAMNEPAGVIAAFAADEHPLLAMVSIVAPAIAMGNRILTIASPSYPLIATDFYQILETSDVPPGVVNIVTGDPLELAPQVAGHADIDAVWSFASADISAVIETESAGNLKRTWVNNNKATDWDDPNTHSFLGQCCEVKTIWIPYGEG